MKKIFSFAAVLLPFLLLSVSCSFNQPEPADSGENSSGTGSGSSGSGNGTQIPDGEYLDISETSSCEMYVGKTIRLYSSMEAGYEVYEGSDCLSIGSGNILEAAAIGEGRIRMLGTDNFYYYCTVSVKADTASGGTSGIGDNTVYPVTGKWISGDSRLQLNSDKTGSMVIYLNGDAVQDETFTWSEFSSSHGRFLTLANSDSSSFFNGGKQYAVTVTDTTLILEGNLGFGMPKKTEWSKE